MVEMRSENFIDLHTVPFSVSGSYLSIMLGDLAGQDKGLGELYLCSERGAASLQGRNKLIKLVPAWNGIHVPYSITTTPYEVRIETRYGMIRMTIPGSGLVRISGSGEIGLEVSSEFRLLNHENIRDMYDGTWQVFYHMICNMLFVPIKGSMEMDAPWDYELTASKYVKALFVPDGNGEMEIALEEFIDFEGKRRNDYPSIEDSVSAVKESFEKFLQYIPHFRNPEYEEHRVKAAWVSWSHIVSASRRIKRPTMIMMHTYMSHCSGWQQCTQAVALSGNRELVYQLLLNIYDFQGEDGMIPDVVSDFWGVMKAGKPPYQGFAILWLLENAQLGQFLDKEQILSLYQPMVKQFNWWRNNRILPGKTLPFFGNPDESGMDDFTVFRKSCQMITPDIATYLTLFAEALSKMASMLHIVDEAEYWEQVSRNLLHEMIEKLWDGERFISRVPDTEEPFASESLCAYQPLLLGKRLPSDIIEKMTSDLSVENDFLTEYGVASEKLSSPYVNIRGGWANGPINSPLQMQIVIGLRACGKTELSKLIANRYCRTLARTGFFHIHNPFTGKGLDKGRDGVLNQHWTSWSSSVFILLASMYTD